MKTWILVSLTTLVLVRAVPAAENQPAVTDNINLARPTNTVRITPELLTLLSEELRTNHPAVHALEWRAQSTAANVHSVRTWEDPMVTLGGMGARQMMRAEDGDLIYGVEQKLPLFGKPQAMRKMAEADAEMQKSKIDVRFQTLRRDLAKTVVRAGLADRAVVLGYEDVAWLETLVNSVEAGYRNGTATLSELIQAQNERARRLNQLRTDESQVVHEHVGINRLMNRSST
ncbi:MAG TPA: TolC family protein, partial [Candidatus Acidoferrum sp.]|nr:TolC family protein [Candidatus Acidoferrum sp.]